MANHNNKPSTSSTNVNKNIGSHPNKNTNKTNSSSDGVWKTQQKSKRIHSDSSVSDNPTSPKPQQIRKKLFSTTNRFEVLSQNDNTDENLDDNLIDLELPIIPDTIKPPPPIFVKGVEDFPELCLTLIELIGVDNYFCKSTSDCLKIQTTNPAAYRALLRFLRDEKAEFHTYQIKEDKPLRVVIRNLHPTKPLNLIKEELTVRLEPITIANEIFKLTSLLHPKIKIEEPYKSKTISQCFNCQQYGHTRAYCGYKSRCVRCGDEHQSSVCPNSRDHPPKCAHCSENHPANYKGCSFYKEIQRRKRRSPTRFKVIAPPGPTYWPSSCSKNPDILDILVSKIPNNLYCTTKNILDLNSDHSSVLLTLNITTKKETPQLFNKFTNHQQFHDLVNAEIQLNIKLKTPEDIDLAVNNLTNIIQRAAWSATNTNPPPATLDSLPMYIRTKISGKRRARALCQRTRLPSHHQNYNHLSNSLKKILVKFKSTTLQNQLSNLSPKEGTLW
ncbi:hypothetical protein QTP88_001798 [Uroleucon formosanum]